MTNKFGISNKKQNWFEKNKGKPVNLLMMHPPRTESGDIVDYNPEENEVILTNYIKRKYYEEEGNSQYVESDGELRIQKSNIESYELTTKEDRKGRIKNYNLELFLEEAGKREKFNELIRKNTKIIK